MSPLTLIFKNRTRRPLGHGAKGVIIPPEGDQKGIFVPSFGVLEQAEIDYIVEAEKEKAEKEGRVTQPRQIQIGRTKTDYEVDIKEV